MSGWVFTEIAAVAIGTVFTATLAFSQTQQALTSGPAKDGSPAWFLQAESPYVPGGRQPFGVYGASQKSPLARDCGGDIAKYCGTLTGSAARACLTQNSPRLSGTCKTTLAALPPPDPLAVPSCSHSPVCDPRVGGERAGLQSVEWKQTMGFTFAYPIMLPEGENAGASAVAVDSKDDLWVFQRNPAGRPQLFEYGPDHKLIRTVDEDMIGHQRKAHGMAIDAHDNVWICDADLATVKEVSPEGKLLKTIGVSGHRGDWVEAMGQRLLWQPMDIAFAPNGDIYIGEGHANESPNDTDSEDPTNNIGASRVIHLDRAGKFVNQWFGNWVGQGRFSMAHGIAVDPRNGDVYIGDREQYRIVVYTADGKFIRTLQMRNLTCALYFDPHGNLWVATGWDGQLIKIDRNGKVLGAIGNGNGIGPGQFLEADFMAMDSHGNLYSGDTARGRVTEMVAPGQRM